MPPKNEATNTNSFVHTHCHSSKGSLLDGMCKIDTLLSRAKELNQPAIAITEHGSLYSAYDFYHSAIKTGIKPLLGIEAYLASRKMTNKEAQDRNRYHMLLLAENNTGWQNIVELSSLAFLEGYYYRPRIDADTLIKYSDGVIATSGCLASVFSQTYLQEGETAATKLLNLYSEIFRDRFYIELQEHSIPELTELNRFLIQYARKNNLPLLATNDVHYTYATDANIHDVLLCIQTKKKQSDENRLRFSDNSYYLKSYDEMAALFDDVPGALFNSLEIAERCNVELINTGFDLPKFEIPKPFASSFSYLKHLVYAGANVKYGELRFKYDQKLQKRIDYELNTIVNLGLVDYFLIIWDICQYAESQNIWWNVRGSGAGSVVNYCLNITNIEPLSNGLLFERFLNPNRVSLADVDLDIEDVRRNDVVNYLRQKWGDEHVAQIITFSVMKARSVLRDAARALDLPLKDADALAKAIPSIPGREITIADVMDSTSEYYNQEFVSLAANAKTKEIVQIAKELEGIERHHGLHAAGVVITDKPLTNYLPLARVENGLGGISRSTQWTMKTIDAMSLLKLDFLGLTTLSAMRECCELIEERHGVKYTQNNIPYDVGHKPLEPNKTPEKIFELLSTGNTVGVFQLESPGMSNLMVEMQPTRFSHIVAAVSLYRPGPKQFIPEYLSGMKGKESSSEYRLLEDILGDTYYSIIYQEQVMQLAQKVAGYDAAEADYIRKAIGKRDPELMATHQQKFIHGAITKGYTINFATKLWHDIEKFAAYSFNRSHASDYAKLSCQTAFLKANYPLEYMTAAINAETSKPDRMISYILEAKRMGIKILPPAINSSKLSFAIEGNAVRFGYNAVKYIGKQAELVVQNMPYTSIEDIFEKIGRRKLGKRALEALIFSGALDEFRDRSTLISEHTKLISVNLTKKEFEYLGLIVSQNFDDINVAPEEYAKFNGVITEIELRRTKFGTPMAYITVNNTIKCIMFGGKVSNFVAGDKVMVIGIQREDLFKIETLININKTEHTQSTKRTRITFS